MKKNAETMIKIYQPLRTHRVHFVQVKLIEQQAGRGAIKSGVRVGLHGICNQAAKNLECPVVKGFHKLALAREPNRGWIHEVKFKN